MTYNLLFGAQIKLADKKARPMALFNV